MNPTEGEAKPVEVWAWGKAPQAVRRALPMHGAEEAKPMWAIVLPRGAKFESNSLLNWMRLNKVKLVAATMEGGEIAVAAY
jgi:hypothetical protein